MHGFQNEVFLSIFIRFCDEKMKENICFPIGMTPDQYNFLRVGERHVPGSDVSQCHRPALVRSRCLSVKKQTWRFLLLWGELDIY